MTQNKDEYQCSVCKGVFDKGWSDEEALDELHVKFPGYEPPQCSIVCDDCFKKMGLGSE